EAQVRLVRILVDVLDAPGVERRRAAAQAVHRIAFGEQEVGQIGAVLTSDASDQGNRWLHESRPSKAGRLDERGPPVGNAPRNGIRSISSQIQYFMSMYARSAAAAIRFNHGDRCLRVE